MTHPVSLRWILGVCAALAVGWGAGCGKMRPNSESSPYIERDIEIAPNIKMTFCWVPATTSDAWKGISGGKDTFTMGSPVDEADRVNDEIPHEVRLTKGFWMGKYEVTQAQWQAVMGSNLSRFEGAQNPVERVSWDDCQAFIRKLNGPYRLPTEAEWEYACRAGTTGAFAGELDRLGWYDGNCGGETHPIGQKAANAWGLCDMHGNVWEWCADKYGEYPKGVAVDPLGPLLGEALSSAGVEYRVYRGGSWFDDAGSSRSADRNGNDPGARGFDLGFRLIYDGPQ